MQEANPLQEANTLHEAPSWFVAPGEGDFTAFMTLLFLLGALYALVYLYAFFDRWAEHKSRGTPLARTIPTLLAIALVYEVFPASHFNILLPLSAVLIALMADWSRFHLSIRTEPEDLAAEVDLISKEPQEHV